jgi:predicted PolB exonuclease-like 3'-5' exonuclease
MSLSSLFIFDIETIPDTDAAPHLTGIDSDDVEARRQALTDYHLEITDGKNSFLRQPFHKVVAISFLEADIATQGTQESYTLTELRSGGKEGSDEAELIKGFFQYLEKRKPRLVSFNGRTFDLPVLKYRAMHHGVQAGWLYHSGDKWNNYMQRYSLNWHCDLLEALSDFGASARIRLNEVCSILGFPGKFGPDGSKVQEMYDAGNIAGIRHYCETDVLNTYLVYLRFMHHQGTLSTAAYNGAVEDLLAFIEGEKEGRSYLGDFYAAWEESCGGKFGL